MAIVELTSRKPPTLAVATNVDMSFSIPLRQIEEIVFVSWSLYLKYCQLHKRKT
ncbi:hypothetical protein KIN20_005526 [Parelaphostrongylus tenuis]|uniref:Uncharacterized protein n=1 Tax=Parelaphostrongylus tenuis TaxID=148309 RepID=A0AAD5MIU7_PARTN|nr:hypothetical protein KIN20_005526 [Parelaphostrongylus tenuis]